jgi:hypothetical protein
MLDFVTPDRVYPPEILMAMSTAFDEVSRSVAPGINGDPDLRRRLALTILRHVDDGERDPDRLSELALEELTGLDLFAVR